MKPRILLTGATGYIGGRLLSQLEAAGFRMRCMARRPEYLRSRVETGTEVVQGDVFDAVSLAAALDGMDIAYYLIHSMGSAGGFEEQDREAARAFGEAAREAGVQRIVYLGGLGSGDDLSQHLASRQEVGKVLRESGVPTTEFRASVIIGSGSLSFQMVRSLVEKLPVMIVPKWVRTKAQPISVEDVLAYLVEELDHERTESRIFEIGGADALSYLEIMQEYARIRGLRRFVIPVPVLTPRLSSLWLGLVTPLFARVGRKLIDGVRNETIVHDDSALREFAVRPRGAAESIERALRNEDQRCAQTRWSDALSSTGEVHQWADNDLGRRLVDSRMIKVEKTREQAFAPIARIGGKNGWYSADFLWRIRGWLDKLVGGPGLRRGRRHPTELRAGDVLDFWRVETVEPGRLLRLSAEMKVPGRAWLQYEIDEQDGNCEIRQTAIFDPAGIFGLMYWYALYPVHSIVFRNMLRAIGGASQ